MRSRAARLTLSATAWMGMGAAAFFAFTTTAELQARQRAARTFDQRARRAVAALTDAGAAQQAYFAAGQDADHWVPKVASLTEEAATAVDQLRASASSDDARRTLMAVSAAITEFGNIDKRVHEYFRAGESLMASDVVFSEGDDAVRRAAAGVATAHVSEQETLEAYERRYRLQNAYALGGAGLWAALVMLALSLTSRERPLQADEESAGASEEPLAELPLNRLATSERGHAQVATAAASASAASHADTILSGAAALCTEISQLRDVGDVAALLSHAARLLDASGLVLWVESASGSELRPALAHGYSDTVLGMMRPVPRSADNAVAAAYRSGTLQVVPSQPGHALGAVVAPLMTADGCVGALTAELRDHREADAAVQAVASILAAQLAGIVPAPANLAAADAPPRIASA